MRVLGRHSLYGFLESHPKMFFSYSPHLFVLSEAPFVCIKVYKPNVTGCQRACLAGHWDLQWHFIPGLQQDESRYSLSVLLIEFKAQSRYC